MTIYRRLTRHERRDLREQRDNAARLARQRAREIFAAARQDRPDWEQRVLDSEYVQLAKLRNTLAETVRRGMVAVDR